MRNIPDDENPRMACPKNYMLTIEYSTDKSYLSQKLLMMQKFHDRKNIAVKKKITYQLKTSHKHSDGLL